MVSGLIQDEKSRMKALILIFLGYTMAIPLLAQSIADSPPAPKRTAEELAELLGSIALYPDALIALILPASTLPSDVVLGARFVAAGGNAATLSEKPWDSSVKALTRYPDTLRWMDENLEWTAQVGNAFIDQPVEVMESIQQLRARAKELGNLVDTPEQRIVMDDSDIRIIPAQPNYIFEPRYDPEVIYYEQPPSGGLLFFSAAYGVGSWLNYDCDWRHHRLYRGEWHEGWDYSRDRNRRDREDYHFINNNLRNTQEWHPDPVRRRVQSRYVNERSSNDGNLTARPQSRDTGARQPRDHHEGIARPKPIVVVPHHGGANKIGEQGRDRKPGNDPAVNSLNQNKSGDGTRGHVAPKSDAPGITGNKRMGNDSRDKVEHKKTVTEPGGSGGHGEKPVDKGGDSRKKTDTTKNDPVYQEHRKAVETPKQAEPRHKEVPPHEDTQKHQDPQRKDTPRHDEAAKHEAPKQQVEKTRGEQPAKEKGKGSDKKKEEDRDKKKDQP